ncbi:MAG: hypothetical protein ACREOH_07530 [Candidatus Entotheonellia bacterium]
MRYRSTVKTTLLGQAGTGEAIAALAEATAIQTEVAHQRLASTWEQMVFAQLLTVWSRIEEHETLAYRLLKDHQRRLKRSEALSARAG